MSTVASTLATSMRKNGKNWHDRRNPFRPAAFSASATSKTQPPERKSKSKKVFEERMARTTMEKDIKQHQAAMKEEKEAERKRRVSVIKERREKKAEKERWDALQAKMGRKRAERKKRREHRNKLLNS